MSDSQNDGEMVELSLPSGYAVRFKEVLLPRLARATGENVDGVEADEIIFTVAQRLPNSLFRSRVRDIADSAPFAGVDRFGIQNVRRRRPDLIPAVEARVLEIAPGAGLAAASIGYMIGFGELETMADNRLREVANSILFPR
jgi:hypothetical protein